MEEQLMFLLIRTINLIISACENMNASVILPKQSHCFEHPVGKEQQVAASRSSCNNFTLDHHWPIAKPNNSRRTASPAFSSKAAPLLEMQGNGPESLITHEYCMDQANKTESLQVICATTAVPWLYKPHPADISFITCPYVLLEAINLLMGMMKYGW